MTTGRRLIAMTVVAITVTVPAAQESLSPGPSARVAAALDLYERGEFARAVADQPLAGTDVATVIAQLTAWAPPSTGTGDALTARQRTAVRFVTDAIASSPIDQLWYAIPMADGALLGNQLRIGSQHEVRPWAPKFPDQGTILPVVSWACDLMPKTGPVEPWERWWWLTSVAVLQQAGEWGALVGNDRAEYRGPAPPPWLVRARNEAKIGGHLAHARARIGADTRLRLAEIVSHAASVTDATGRFTVGPRTSMAKDGRYDVIRHLEEAVSRLNSRPFAELERDFLALQSEPGLEGEVALRIAQLRLLRKDWKPALKWLDRATAASTDPTHLATADYFRGWVLERTDQPADALTAYRRAFTRYPRSPNLNSLYAVQLMLAGERAEAGRVLESTMRAGSSPGWKDLWQVLVSGDGRLAQSLALRMREAR